MRKTEAQRTAEVAVLWTLLIAAGVALGFVLNQNGRYRHLRHTWLQATPKASWTA